MPRLAELCLKSGLTGFPRKHRDQHILLKSVALTLDSARRYTESEIDDKLLFWLNDIARSIDFDHVSLRRMLVDERYLVRERSGSSYIVNSARGIQAEFELEVDEVDVYESIGVSTKLIQQRKQAHLQ